MQPCAYRIESATEVVMMWSLVVSAQWKSVRFSSGSREKSLPALLGSCGLAHSSSGEGPTSLLRRSDDEPGIATIFFDEQPPRRHGRIPSSSAMSHPGHETNCGDSCGLTFR